MKLIWLIPIFLLASCTSTETIVPVETIAPTTYVPADYGIQSHEDSESPLIEVGGDSAWDPKRTKHSLMISTVYSNDDRSDPYRLDSIEAFIQFLNQVEKGKRVEWSMGCMIYKFTEDEDVRRKFSESDYFLPLGSEKLSITDTKHLCESRGISFEYDYGY